MAGAPPSVQSASVPFAMSGFAPQAGLQGFPNWTAQQQHLSQYNQHMQHTPPPSSYSAVPDLQGRQILNQHVRNVLEADGFRPSESEVQEATMQYMTSRFTRGPYNFAQFRNVRNWVIMEQSIKSYLDPNFVPKNREKMRNRKRH